MTLKRRIGKLEAAKAQLEPGGFEIVGVGLYDATAGELARLEAEAWERVGPGGQVVVFQYVDDWRGTEP